MRLKFLAVIGAVITLICCTPSFAATQTPQVWTTNIVAGEYPSQEAALAAIRAQGGIYAFAENVEDVIQSETATTYVYGANPRGPEIGPWGSYTMQHAQTNPHPSEGAAIASVKAWGDNNGANCPLKTTVTPTTEWRTSQTWYSGDNTMESRLYDVEISVPPDCYRNNLLSQSFRTRTVACPTGLEWNSTDRACTKNDVARISTRPMPCSPCDIQHNPVNVNTGDKYQLETDFILSWLTLTRHYHSAYSLPGARLGGGWTHSLNQRLYMSGSNGGLILANGDTLPIRNSETVDGSGWRVAYVSGSYELTKPTQTLHFNTSGKLTKIDDLNGSVTTLQYDATGRLATTKHSSGRSVSFEYEAVSYAGNAHLIAIKSDGIALVNYVYDGVGRLEYATYPNGSTRRYHYENAAFPQHLTGITDEVEARYSTYAYNANGWTTLSEHAGGVYRGTFDYKPDGSTLYTDADGRNQVFRFTADGAYRKITDITDIAGTQSTTYTPNSTDFRRRPLSRVDKRGISTTYSYSDYYDAAFGMNVRRTTTNAAVGTPQAKTVQEWKNLSTGWLLKLQDSVSTTSLQRGTRGQVLSQTRTDSATGNTRITTTTYCEQANIDAGTCSLLGLPTSVDGPRTDVSDVTVYAYRMAEEASCATVPAACPYRKGDLWKVTNALGHVTETLKYDSAGRVLSVKDANGVVTDMEYHPRGWLTARKMRGPDSAVETDDQITRIEYWPTGLVKKVTQPDGAFTSYTYDAAHRLTDITDASGNTLHYTLDNAGNKTKEDTKDAQGALKRTLSRVYNQLGQLQTQKTAAQHPTGFGYDPNGNVDTVTDALTRVTDNDYDPLDRLKRTLQDVGGIEAETRFDYDALDHLTKVTDPKGLDTHYVYNGLGDLTQLRSPDTGTTDYTVDSAGNRKTQTDARGITSTYAYDALNRLKTIAYSDGSPGTSFTYDTASQTACIRVGGTSQFMRGRLSKMIDASGSTQYCYDRFGHMVGKLTSTGALLNVSYRYNPAGQLTSVNYPNNLLVDYVRDSQGRIIEVGARPAGGARQVLLHQITYHPFGPVASWTYGNGRTLQRPLNQDYQPLAIADASPGGLSLGYEFNAVGNLTKLHNADQSALLARYDYDALNRLIDVKDGPTGTPIEHYDYDDTGNRTGLTTSAGTTPYVYPATSHRLASVGATARSYDAVGNTTTIGGLAKEFVYSGNNRMQQVKQNGVATMTYAYNGKGEQVRRTAGSISTHTVYDEAGHWLGDYTGSSTAIQNAIWLDDLPVGLMANNQLHYLEPDHLGTPRVVIDPVRNVAVWTWELKGEAFGNTVPNQNPDNDANTFVFNMRFPGQRYDAASGLNYNYFRDYESGTGRYSQSDPIGQAGGTALYGYGLSNPLIRYDYFGLASNCRIETSYDGGYGLTGELRKTGVGLKEYKVCIPYPVIMYPGFSDAMPDPRWLRRRIDPFGIPWGIAEWCKRSFIQKLFVERRRTMHVVNFEVCRDDCGGLLSRTVVSDSYAEKWESAGFETKEWSEGWYYVPPPK